MNIQTLLDQGLIKSEDLNINNQRMYDGDSPYKGTQGYRFQNIDTPEMPTTEEKSKLNTLADAKNNKILELQGKTSKQTTRLATAGEAAKLEAQLLEVDPIKTPMKGLGDTLTSLDDATDTFTQIYTGSQYMPQYNPTQRLDKTGTRILIDNPEFQKEMVSKGYAVPAFNPSEELVQSAQQAKDAKLGLWGTDREAIQDTANKRGVLVETPTEERTERTWGEATSDIAMGLGSGLGSAVKGIGDLYGLATGDTENALSMLGEVYKESYNKEYSDPLKLAVERQQAEIDLEKDELGKFMKTVSTSVENPELAVKTIVESIPAMLVAGGAGRLATVLTNSAKIGTGVALGIGGVQQGVDMGKETYDRLIAQDDKYWEQVPEYKALVAQDVGTKEAKEMISLDIARSVAGASGTAGVLLNKFTPGGSAIESALASGLTKGTIKKAAVGTAGEGATELGEEGSGKTFQNIGVQQVNPEQQAFEGVGQAAGTGLVAGVGMGGTVKGIELAVSSLPKRVETAPEEVVPQTAEMTSMMNTELKKFEDSVANGGTNLDGKAFVDFLNANKDVLDTEQLQKIVDIKKQYTQNVESAKGQVFDADGNINTQVLKSNPILVDELISQLNSVDTTPEKATQMVESIINKNVLTDYTDGEINDLRERVLALKSSTADMQKELSAVKSVSNDILVKGFLNHKGLVDTVMDGDLQDKQNFLNYETQKAEKLDTSIDQVKVGLERLVGGDTKKLMGLAYLEGLNVTDKKPTVSREYERQMLIEAAKLMGIRTSNGTELRNAYKDSQLAKEVKALDKTISDFSDSRYSKNEGEFTVHAWQALGEMVDPGKAGTLRKPGYRKLRDAIGMEVSVLQKAIDGATTKDTLVRELIDRITSEKPTKKEKVVEEPTVKKEEKKDELLTKLKAIEDVVEDTAFEGSPKEAVEKAKELKKQIVEKKRAYKAWTGMAYDTLSGLFTELKEIKAKLSSTKELYEKRTELSKSIDAIKKDIVKSKAELDKVNAEITRKESELKEIKNLAHKSYKSIAKVKADIQKLKIKARELATNIRGSKVAKEALVVEKAKVDASIKEAKEKGTEATKEVESKIASTQQAIEESIVDKQEIKNLEKQLKEVQKAYKAGDKGYLKSKFESVGFTGWSTEVKFKDVELPALSTVLTKGKGILPLAVVKASELNETATPVMAKRVQKLVTLDGKLSIGEVKGKKGKFLKDGDKVLNKSVISYNSPALAVMMNENFEVDENVAVAMHAAMYEWLGNDARPTSELTTKDIAKLYGIEESDMTDEMANEVRLLGIPVRFVAEKLGGNVLHQLGLQLTKENIPEKNEVFTRLKESLGMYTIKLAENAKFVTLNSASYNDVAGVLGREKIDAKSDVKINTLTYNVGAGKKGSEMYAKVKEAYGLSDVYKNVKFEKPSVVEVNADIRRNKLTKAPERLLEAKKDAMLKEWHIKGIDGQSVVAEMFELGRDKVKKLNGMLTDSEINKLPFSSREAAKSKNSQISRSVDSLFDVKEMIDNKLEDNSMWFDYFIGKNGRIYVDSEGLNNQSDKLHRSLMYMDEQVSTVEKGTRSEDIFKVAVAQAFGFDIDKESTVESIKFADRILANAEDVEKGWNLLKEGKKEFTVGEDTIKIKELGHLLDGIQAVRDYSEAKDSKFETSILVEADAVTSGFALKLMQIVGDLGDKLGDSETTVKDWLAKVGVFVGGNDVLLGNKYITDSYKTLAKGMTDEKIRESAIEGLNKKKGPIADMNGTNEQKVKRVEDATTKLTEVLGSLTDSNGEVTKFARSLFKPPFMTFMYGAGFPKIRKELAAMVIDEVMSKVGKYYDGSMKEADKTKLEDLLGFATNSDGKKAVSRFMNEDIKKGTNSLYSQLEQLVDITYGNTVESVMKAEFGEILATNNAVLGVMGNVYSVWEAKFKEKIADKPITIDNIEEYTNELIEDFPLVKSPFSNSIEDSIALFKTELAKTMNDAFEGKYTNAGITTEADGKTVQLTVPHMIYLYREAAAAAGVIPIHTLDSSIMNTTVIGESVQQIFDAIMGGVNNIEDVVTKYNKTVFDVSMNWSFIGEVLNTVERVLAKPENKEYVSKLDRDEINSNIERLVDVYERNNKFKEDFKAKGGIIEHMVFSDKTSYEVKRQPQVKPEDILGIVNNRLMDKINSKLDKPLEQMFKDCMGG